jgi:hypothetical protein
MENRMKDCQALAIVFVVALSLPLHADHVRPPRVPATIQVPAGSVAFLEGHAVGTQNYICLPSGASVAWTLFGPQATLFTDRDKQIITHFLSPNPEEGGTPRATWQHSRDTSSVWALAVATSTDSAFVAPGAIPWLRLDVVGAQAEPKGGDALSDTTHIHRVNTSGGVAPSTGCSVTADIGKRMFVPYTADYIFYRDRPDDQSDRK